MNLFALKTRRSLLAGIVLFAAGSAQAQTNPILSDSFEGTTSAWSWFGDQCLVQQPFNNPQPHAVNPSAGVLRYHDQGGTYANVRLDLPWTLNLGTQSRFKLKVYIPSSGLSGNQAPRISLKLQNNGLAMPWSTQCEILQPLGVDQWQEVVFDFRRDPWINLSAASPSPLQRTDFNRIVLQINGENNSDQVLAYLDDFLYDTTGYYSGGRALVWSDEFESNGGIDTNKWFPQTLLPNGTGWYNNELQHYTNLPSNAYIANGALNLVARRQNHTQQGVLKAFTSARLNSKFAFRYGRVECRARLPMAAGTWPAIWTLGRNVQEPGAYWQQQGFAGASWPACGEIDIMEHWGTQPEIVHSSVHTPSSFGGTVNTATRRVTGVGSQYHTYSLDWSPQQLTFAINGQTLYTYQPNPRTANNWPFDAPQYLLMNVAMVAGSSPLFQADSLQIDYIRIYQDSLDLPGPLLIRGRVQYANTHQDTINKGKVLLYHNNRWMRDSSISAQGNAGFYGLAPGTYRLSALPTTVHGGLNASDALAVALHFAQVQTLQGLYLKAADVNGNGAVNANDALNIALRYSGQINTFAKGDWVSDETVVSLPTSVQNPLAVPVLCTGDVNGSYRPPLQP